MTTFTRNSYNIQSAAAVIPNNLAATPPITLSGTLTSHENYVTGTGTSFLTEIADADANEDARTTNYGYLWDGNVDLVKITGVIDDEHLILRDVPSGIISSTCQCIKVPKFKEITIIGGTGGGKLNGQTLAEGTQVTFRQDYSGQLLEPMIAQNVLYTVRW